MANSHDSSQAPIVPAALSVALGIFWIVVMAGCWEWPKYDTFREGDYNVPMGVQMYFRRWPSRFGRVSSETWSTPCIPSCETKHRRYIDIADIVTSNLTTCPPLSRRQSYTRGESSGERDLHLRWICGSAADVAAFLNPVADSQIVALALCPVLTLLMGLGAFAAHQQSRLWTRVWAVLVGVVGAFVCVTLFVTIGLLSEFNRTGRIGGGKYTAEAPSAQGWAVAPAALIVFTCCVAVLCVASCATLGYAASEQPPEPLERPAPAPEDSGAVAVGVVVEAIGSVDGVPVDSQPTAETAVDVVQPVAA